MALVFTDSVEDIGMPFVERPDASVDAACLDRLSPRRILPPT